MNHMNALSPTDFLKIGHRTAHHFGFSSLDALVRPLRTQRQFGTPKASMADRRLDALDGNLTGGITAYFEQALHDEKPSLFFSTHEVPKTEEVAFALHVVGVKKSIAESLLIQALRSLIRDLGYASHCVRINSLGDHDSVIRVSGVSISWPIP
jgi:hypothetical protein